VICPDPESLTSYLQRQMSITKMPGDAQQVRRFGGVDFKD
jgi:hypothetical protein